MRPKSDCIACLVERTKYECDLAFSSSENEREKISALREVLAFLVEHLGEEGRSPAFFGTERERIIKRRSSASGGARDIHAEVKRRSNEVARGLLPVARKFYEAAASGAGERAERGRAPSPSLLSPPLLKRQPRRTCVPREAALSQPRCSSALPQRECLSLLRLHCSVFLLSAPSRCQRTRATFPPRPNAQRETQEPPAVQRFSLFRSRCC